MNTYKLLTPGPLTTSDTVKQEMLFDHCTWDDDYKQITQRIRKDLLTIAHVDERTYTSVLMQGSGTFGVESVISSILPKDGTLLLLSNGAYGERIAKMCTYHNIKCIHIEQAYNLIPDAQKAEEALKEHSEITHVAMIHSETTSGILNDIHTIGELCAKYQKTFIVDAMSSFGGVDIDLCEDHIDFLVSSANKCIQGVPGFSFIIANREKLIASKGNARSLSLDLYDQWVGMEKDGKWRYTSPTHVVLAFAKAMEELEEEGGVAARSKRYYNNMKTLIDEFEKLGFKPYVEKAYQGPIITTFLYPKGQNFNFQSMYDYIKERGYAIYPGKLTDADTFRIGTIGEIYEEDIHTLTSIMKDYMKGDNK
ncbi:MAG: 2-aminoethylphosphonate--pyruvate transaminase [Longicatena sp.]